MVALDVGGAIKGQHFDIYQGIGPEAGHMAGFFNHYGRVWVLRAAPAPAARCSAMRKTTIMVQCWSAPAGKLLRRGPFWPAVDTQQRLLHESSL